LRLDFDAVGITETASIILTVEYLALDVASQRYSPPSDPKVFLKQYLRDMMPQKLFLYPPSERA